MEISATVKSSSDQHQAIVTTAGVSQTVDIRPKAAGLGSSVNGGELLLLALATCYCNDLYREAARLGIALGGVEVRATANFPGVGLAASDIRYFATVESSASAEAIRDLLQQTDAVAEVHNTIRAGLPVELQTGP